MLLVVATMTFFPTLIACERGLAQVPRSTLDVFDSYAVGRFRVLRLARFPAMLPALFAAARVAVPSALVSATVAEWLATGTGIGNLMALASATGRYDTLWASVCVLTVVAISGFALVGVVERRVLLRYAPGQLS